MGYAAWKRIKEVSDTTGKRSPEYSTRSPCFLAVMGSTCKQGKPNGNQKREGTTLILGRRRSKKQRLTLLKVIGSKGCLPSS
ncbi:ribosomal protein S10 [Medicago truncatula]|uniref:Ribosomal protein S10 n=1 Tax=Medicago truncatula TaxID=3880 RepID=A0A072THT1_MEDTR|nr:ribosomal protein S10 [Medicago truncatula]